MKGVTTYQAEILEKIGAAPENELVDIDQLLERLSWGPTKESLQFPIRSLISKGLIEKNGLQLRRGRKRVTYRLTEKGRFALDPRPTSATAEKVPNAGGPAAIKNENDSLPPEQFIE